LVVIPKKRRENVQHSAQWNEELFGWQERKKLQKGLHGAGKEKRAAIFYTFYFIIGILNLYAIHTVRVHLL
jgi:hypothetical protein